jgi:NADPH-dependent ferric siderophore reductase
MNRPRPNRRLRNATVVETAWLTPHTVRIIVEGPELDGFVVGEFTDHYVKCRFGESTRTYTVRDWDADRLRLTLDFVVHGDEGPRDPGRLPPVPATPSRSPVPAAGMPRHRTLTGT